MKHIFIFYTSIYTYISKFCKLLWLLCTHTDYAHMHTFQQSHKQHQKYTLLMPSLASSSLPCALPHIILIKSSACQFIMLVTPQGETCKKLKRDSETCNITSIQLVTTTSFKRSIKKQPYHRLNRYESLQNTWLCSLKYIHTKKISKKGIKYRDMHESLCSLSLPLILWTIPHCVLINMYCLANLLFSSYFFGAKTYYFKSAMLQTTGGIII
jgi:hypothetical protein